jgi:hypothetical protein
MNSSKPDKIVGIRTRKTACRSIRQLYPARMGHKDIKLDKGEYHHE